VDPAEHGFSNGAMGWNCVRDEHFVSKGISESIKAKNPVAFSLVIQIYPGTGAPTLRG
jgi:hypothetical protein